MLRPETLKALGRAFKQRIDQKEREYDRLAMRHERPKMGRAQWAGTKAQDPWIEEDLKRCCGICKRLVQSDVMSAVSNLGGPRRTDALAVIDGEIVQFELKRSDYGGSRVWQQLNAQVFDLGLGTYNATALVVIYGEDRRIDVYKRDDARRAVDATQRRSGGFEVPAPTEIRF